MPRRSARIWEIAGSYGSEQIFQTTVPCGSITQDQLHALLRALVAKFGLTPREIVGSYLKRGAKGYMAHLEIAKYNSNERKSTDHCCGDSPEFVARVIQAEKSPHTVRSNRRPQQTRKARG
jgi:hypothetical protein